MNATVVVLLKQNKQIEKVFKAHYTQLSEAEIDQVTAALSRRIKAQLKKWQTESQTSI